MGLFDKLNKMKKTIDAAFEKSKLALDNNKKMMQKRKTKATNQKRKLKKLKTEQKLLTQDSNIESMCLLFILTLFSLLICHDQQASYYIC